MPARRCLPAVLAAMVALVACFGGGRPDGGPPATPAEKAPAEGRPQGGVVRVGTWMRPEHDQPTSGGAAVRSLVHPQLHTVGPDGSWEPSAIDGGSVERAADGLSVSFRFRPDAVWSTGAPLGADDLRRAYDTAAVAGIDGPDDDGRVTVRFTSALQQWQRLWSFDDTIAPPAVGVWGGPWQVAAMTPGLETVLVPNPRWWGTPAVLDELRLVVVPDSTTALQLLEDGELDVVSPPPATGRSAVVAAIDGVRSQTATVGGWWFGLHTDPASIDGTARRALFAAVPRIAFTTALLRGEAEVLDGFGEATPGPWARPDPASAVPAGRAEIQVLSREEEPMVGVLARAISRRALDAGWRPEVVAMEADEAEARFRERRYQAAAMGVLDPPTVCWRCRWGWFDDGLAAAADAGDAAAATTLQLRLRDEAIVMPLWRPAVVVAWRTAAVRGVRVNGYAHSPAWNAQEWWVPAQR